MTSYRNFKQGNWNKTIDVSDFIKLNFTSYEGDASFLQGTTERTDEVRARVDELLIEENKKGGVLDVDTENVLSILTYEH